MSASSGPQERLTFQAAFDFSAAQYVVAAQAGAGIMGLATSATANSSAGPVGIVQTKPQSGENGTVAVMGRSKGVAGAAFGYGRFLTTNSSGRLIAATSGNWIVGRAREAAGADGDIVSVYAMVPWRGGAV